MLLESILPLLYWALITGANLTAQMPRMAQMAIGPLLDTLTSWYGLIAGVIAGLAASVGVLYRVGKSVHKFHANVMEMADKVHYELSPNGGKSLRDTVETIHDMVKEQGAVLARLSAQVRLASQGVEYGVLEFDSRGYCVFANRYLVMLFGKSEADFHGFGWINMVEESERREFRKAFEEAVQTRSALEYSVPVVIEELEMAFVMSPVGGEFQATMRIGLGKLAGGLS